MSLLQKYLGKIKIEYVPYVILALMAVVYVLAPPVLLDGKLTTVYTVGVGQAFTGEEPLVGLHHPPLSSVLVIVYYLLVTALGFFLVSPLLRKCKVPTVVKVGASFIPGYLATVPINRILTIIFPHRFAPEAIWLALIGLVIALYVAVKPLGEAPDYKKFAKKALVSTLILSVVLAALLIFTIQNDDMFMTGDSTGFAFSYLRSIFPNPDPSAHYPLVNQHYDEVIFNYPLIFRDIGDFNALIFFWLVTTCGKLSVIFLCYSLFVFAGLSRVMAAAGTLFFVAGTNAASPQYYATTFDSKNPLLVNLHIGRITGAILPWFLILYFRALKELRSRSEEVIATLALVLMGLGIAGTSFHNIIYSALTLFVCAVYRPSATKFLVPPALAIAIGVLIAPTLTFAASFDFLSNFYGVLLLLATIAGGCLVVWRLLTIPRAEPLGLPTRRILIMAAVLLVFSFLVGNVPGDILVNTAHKLGLISFDSQSVFLTRHVVEFARDLRLIPRAWCFPDFPHCTSGFNFIGYFGPVTVLAISTLTLLYRREKSTSDDLVKTEVNFYLLFLLLYSVTFCAAFLPDFTFANPTVTLSFARFREVPYYGMVFVCFLTIGRFAPKRHHWAMLLVSGIWAITPFICYRLDQWIANLNYLLLRI